MFKISKNNEIEMTKGDTGRFEVNATSKDGIIYNFNAEDVITFSVKRNVFETEYILQKTIQDCNTITIEPSDTTSLAVGKYVYDMQINLVTGDVITVITPRRFEILAEVTV